MTAKSSASLVFRLRFEQGTVFLIQIQGQSAWVLDLELRPQDYLDLKGTNQEMQSSLVDGDFFQIHAKEFLVIISESGEYIFDASSFDGVKGKRMNQQVIKVK